MDEITDEMVHAVRLLYAMDKQAARDIIAAVAPLIRAQTDAEATHYYDRYIELCGLLEKAEAELAQARAQERERCAKVAERAFPTAPTHAQAEVQYYIVRAIRAPAQPVSAPRNFNFTAALAAGDTAKGEAVYNYSFSGLSDEVQRELAQPVSEPGESGCDGECDDCIARVCDGEECKQENSTLRNALSALAAGKVDAEGKPWPAQPVSEPVCQMCDGRGEIGGFDTGDNAYRTEPCPDCAQPVSEPKADLMKIPLPAWMGEDTPDKRQKLDEFIRAIAAQPVSNAAKEK